MIRAAIIYWLVLNCLNVLGGLIGWFQLKQSKQRVAHYLARILIAEALRSALSIVAIRRFRANFAIEPYMMFGSVAIVTLLGGAIWGWLFYSHGFINGGGWLDLLKWKNKQVFESRNVTEHLLNGGDKMEDKRPDEEQETDESPATTPTSPANAGDGTQGDDEDEEIAGVGDGPGK